MYISYRKSEFVDSQKIEIYREDDPYFWHHKGRKPEEKEELRKFAKLLPSSILKVKNGEKLTDDEKYSYDIFVTNPPDLSYDEEHDIYTIVDGRHRMYILREEGINIELEVKHTSNFKERTSNELFQDIKMSDIFDDFVEIDKNEKKLVSLIKMFKEIFHINNRDRFLEELDNKYSNVIDKIAIIDKEINKKFLYELGIDFYEAYSLFSDNDYLIITNENENLEELIKRFSENEILVSTQNIRFNEER